MSRHIFSTLSIVALIAVFAVVPVVAQDVKPACDPESPAVAAFDFWEGQWDLAWEGGKGTNKIERILDGCSVYESFADDKGFTGHSWSVYNPATDMWRQTWVDNQGNYLLFEGGLNDDGDMELRGEGVRNGQRFLTRMRFTDVTDDALDWYWERSTDGGESWETRWLIHYRRH